MSASRPIPTITCLFGVAILVVILAAGCAATVTPTPGGSGLPSDSPVATPTDSTSAACLVVPQSGLLRSNTLVGMAVDSDGAFDRTTFTFGPNAAGPTGGTGRLTAGTPPFVQGGSGLPVTVLGSHFVELHLDGMLITDDAGNEVYQGPTSLRPDMIAIKDIEETDGFEGVYNFVIGYEGNGCVGLSGNTAAGLLTITIGH